VATDKKAKTKLISSKSLWYLAVGHIATASGEGVRPSKKFTFERHHSVKEESTSIHAVELSNCDISILSIKANFYG
jgi:hypothetical protein